MLLEREHCYQALVSRDTRFDGRFFVGVTSTGIYCRPVCGVRAPMPENCRYFISAAAAEMAGYRPCLRCRPELAPGRSELEAGSRLAANLAMRLRTELAGEVSLSEVAAQLGVTDRHLRRVFREAYGVAPIQYAQTQRLLMAKRLLADSRLPVTEIAMASGFQSLRRFNSLIKERYRLTPTAMRSRTRTADGVAGPPTFEIAFQPPLDWDFLLEFLAARAIPGVERVVAGQYARTLAVRGCRGIFTVERALREGYLRVGVTPGLIPVLAHVLERVRRLFDLGADPARISLALGALAQRFPGVRVPGCVDEFELAVRAILGQQISVKGARTLAGRLAQAFGGVWDGEGAEPLLSHFFPSAQELAAREPGELAALGLTGARAYTLVTLARAVARGELDLSSPEPIHVTMTALRRLPGIGEWTAQYVAMRALAWPDAFPHGDLVLRKALGGVTPRRCLELAEAWRPWRAYAAICLWRRGGSSQPDDSFL